MVNPFQVAVLKLSELGAFEFLFPFMLSSAIFYGLLRKSQVFGDPDKNIAVNATVSIVASFMVWAYPILIGVSIEQQLSKFFLQGMVATLVIMLGALISSMFFGQDLSKQLAERFGGNKGFWVAIFGGALLIGAGILMSSGLIDVFFPGGGLGNWMSSDTSSTIAVAVLILASIWVVVGGGGKSKGGND